MDRGGEQGVNPDHGLSKALSPDPKSHSPRPSGLVLFLGCLPSCAGRKPECRLDWSAGMWLLLSVLGFTLLFLYFLLGKEHTERRMCEHRHILKITLIPEITDEGLHPSTQHEKHHKHLLNPCDLLQSVTSPVTGNSQLPKHVTSVGKES